jgi:5'(3')-deoxyribonucleotidase
MAIDRVEPKFWGTYKGRIIKSISIDGARTWDDIQELTGFNPKTINTVLSELFTLNAMYKTSNGEYRVSKDLYQEYRLYFSESGAVATNTLKVKKEDQQNIVREFQSFLSMKKLVLADNHTFLEGGRLNDLTSHLIENVRTELLIVNPFVDKTNMVNDMKGSAQKGRKIRLLIRPPEGKDKCDVIDKLQEYGMEILTNPSVHAKIMVFDRGVAIISSMNLYAYSVGGGSWEAGIATCSEDVLNDVLNGINMKFDEKETCVWKKESNRP